MPDDIFMDQTNWELFLDHWHFVVETANRLSQQWCEITGEDPLPFLGINSEGNLFFGQEGNLGEGFSSSRHFYQYILPASYLWSTTWRQEELDAIEAINRRIEETKRRDYEARMKAEIDLLLELRQRHPEVNL